jgi:nitrite reductase (NADH) large subunit
VEIVDGTEGTHRMNFADGTHLDTDMIVFSAGIRPRDELARASGLTVGARGGIVIDNNCLTSTRTSTPSANARCGTARSSAWWPGLRHGPRGRPASARRSLEFAGADMSTKLKLMGVDVASIGDPHGNEPGSRSYQFTDERKQIYKKIVVSECGKFLLGGVLVGDAAEYGTLLQMMLNRSSCRNRRSS